MSTGKAVTFTAGLVQMRSGLSPQANLDAAVRLIEDAKSAGADYVLTPEMTNILEIKRERLFATIAPEENDLTLAAMRELARKLGIFLHVGSLAIKLLPEKAANRSFLIDRNGDIVARYDKIHMFDVELDGGESYRESRSYRPGEIGVAADLPWGRLGLTICYDLRFPALYRALAEAGCSFLAIPSAFTKQTGEAQIVTNSKAEPAPRQVVQHGELARPVAPRLAIAFAVRQIDVEHVDLVVARDDLAARINQEAAVGRLVDSGLYSQRADVKMDR